MLNDCGITCFIQNQAGGNNYLLHQPGYILAAVTSHKASDIQTAGDNCASPLLENRLAKNKTEKSTFVIKRVRHSLF